MEITGFLSFGCVGLCFVMIFALFTKNYSLIKYGDFKVLIKFSIEHSKSWVIFSSDGNRISVSDFQKNPNFNYYMKFQAKKKILKIIWCNGKYPRHFSPSYRKSPFKKLTKSL